MRAAAGLALFLMLTTGAAAAAAEVRVVAAENFYGDIARQIGGARAAVTSILNSPDQDPHLFEASPRTVMAFAAAPIAIVNGAGYDPWAEKLVQNRSRPRIVVNAAQATGWKAGGNPHLWYDPAAMPAVAKAIAAAFTKVDPRHADAYAARLALTLSGLDRITQRVVQMRARHAGKAVTAIEPVFGPMADALGLTVRNQDFQRAMMNGTEPGARAIAAFEDDLRQRKVKALIYNTQVSEKLTERLIAIARQAKVPVIGVTETMPANTSFVDWMLGQLDALDKALSGTDS